MTETELETLYTQLAEAIARVGTNNTALFLSTLSLALLAQQTNFEQAQATITQAEQLAAL